MLNYTYRITGIKHTAVRCFFEEGNLQWLSPVVACKKGELWLIFSVQVPGGEIE
jgi:hypothetical protein